MASDKRRGDEPIPENTKELMTDDQILALRNLESFGWSLKFVRRPKFAPIEVILVSNDGKSYAILGDDGELDEKTPVSSREISAEALADAGDVESADDLQTLAELAAGEPPSPAEATPMAEPVPSSSNDALPDSEDIPPPKFMV